MRRFRPRKEFKFWLYHDIAEDVKLMEYIAYLYASRQFARTIRNGLRLMWTLGQGDLSVLFELFPGIKSSLNSQYREDIDELKRLIKENCNSSAQPILDRPAIKTLLPVAVSEDEDNNMLILNRVTSTDSTHNFLAGFASFE